MIITKADIGRKAIARDGSQWVISLADRSSYYYPFVATEVNKETEMDVAPNGRFWDNGRNSEFDLIRWADETEGAQ
jgi:hypothetical protein